MRLRNIKNADEIINSCDYVVKFPEIHKGKWRELFGDYKDLKIEIGMGKGDFIIEMARRNPEIAFIGMEKYSSVMVKAIEKLKDEKIENLKLVLFDAKNIVEIFAENELSGIYLNFSDPWPKAKHAKRRLTSYVYLSMYSKILDDSAYIIQKTDNDELFEYSYESFLDNGYECVEKNEDLHNSTLSKDNVCTEYERKFSAKGIHIKYGKYKKITL